MQFKTLFVVQSHFLSQTISNILGNNIIAVHMKQAAIPL